MKNIIKSLFSGIYKTSCKTGEGVEDMFNDIAKQLAQSNRSRIELQTMEETAFHVAGGSGGGGRVRGGGGDEDSCSC